MCRDDSVEVPLLRDGIYPLAGGAWALGKTQGLNDRHDYEPVADDGEGDGVSQVLGGEVGYQQCHALPACNTT